jgi:GTP diphosphokinase / guanosine-3',5'-bis(diphosphate) 3'-diphosphatase
MIRINDVLDRVADYSPDTDLDIIDRAYIFSARVHEGQMRLSGEPYLSHPLEVAGILADMNLDPVSIAAGLLHDVVEDTHATPEEIESMFGPEVRRIVSGVTKISALPLASSQARQAESIRKMILAMADDIRVILIKLADRLHNMRTLGFHHSEKKKAQDRPGNHGHLRAPGRPSRDLLDQEGVGRHRLHVPSAGGLPAHQALVNKDREEREKYVETVKSFIQQKMDESQLALRGPGPLQAFFQHLPQDAPRTSPLKRSTTSSPSASSWTPSPSATRPWG